jgi:pimeloyl-ACP methyl ester carboxylesterase
MTLMDADEREVMWNGDPVRYFTAGSGPPLVLLHGLGGSAVVWHRNLPALAERYTVFAPDLWGPGRYTKGPAFSLDLGVAFLTGFLDAVGHRSAHVVGSSLGGLLAGFTAFREPARLRSLTLVDCAGLGREIALSQRLLSLPIVGEVVFRPSVGRIRRMLRLLIRDPGGVSEELVQELYRARAQPGVARQMLAVLRSGVNVLGVKRSVQLTTHLGAITMPALVMWGARDSLFPLAHAYRAVAELPNAELRIFEDAGHWSYVECPERFNEALLGFLDGVSEPANA